MEYKGYTAIVAIAEEDGTFKGMLDVEPDIVTWYATNFEQFQYEFHKAVDDYIQLNEELNRVYGAPYLTKAEPVRGFKKYVFKDFNGKECSLQESSVATDSAIWIGFEEIGLREFVAHRQPSAWVDVELENTIEHHYIANTRMHLTLDQVKALLPFLKRFVDTGEL